MQFVCIINSVAATVTVAEVALDLQKLSLPFIKKQTKKPKTKLCSELFVLGLFW